MTRHQGFAVWVSPEVEGQIRELARRNRADARQVISAQNRLAREGTRAAGAKKLGSLDLWEVRAGRVRLFFCPVRGTRQLAVGAMAIKTTSRLQMASLKTLEHAVHGWRSELEVER